MTATIDVETTHGPVRGAVEDVAVFRGIPYAAPPTGARRFAAPEPPDRWSAPLDARRFGPAAPQRSDGPLSGLVPGMDVGTTDEARCLTLNVWTPALDGAARPVLVWLHGGAFSLGAASLPVYDGAQLARRGDVVVVSCNYRLGVLGYLLVDDPTCSANCGVLDQIAALRWVHDNIEAFGGDPRAVTVLGESAGGGSVLSLLAAPAARPLVTRAICQSGATDLLLDRDRAAAVAEAVARHAGTGATAAELRSLPVENLLDAQAAAAADLLATVGTMPLHPVVDGSTLTATWHDALAAGEAAAIPLLIGTTADEMRLFVDTMPGRPVSDRAGLVARLASLGAPDPEVLADAYEEAVPSPAGPDDRWWRALTDRSMWLPAVALAEAQCQHQPATYMYRFDWPAADPRLGACHGIDIPFPFDTVDRDGWGDFVADAGEARGLAHRVQDAWIAFARWGDPSCEAVGPWPRYDTTTRPTMILGRECAIEDDPNGSVRAAWRGGGTLPLQ